MAQNVQISKRRKRGDEVRIFIGLPRCWFIFVAGLLRIAVEVVRNYYDKYHTLTGTPGEVSQQEISKQIDLSALVENSLLSGQAREVGDLAKEALNATGSLIKDVCLNDPDWNITYPELICALPDKSQEVQSESSVAIR